MTIDEVLLVDRALAAEEIAQCAAGSRALKERAFPVVQPPEK